MTVNAQAVITNNNNNNIIVIIIIIIRTMCVVIIIAMSLPEFIESMQTSANRPQTFRPGQYCRHR